MAKEKNPSIYNPGGETTLGLNNSGISDDGHGYFINKEAEAARLRKESATKPPGKKRGGKVKKQVKAEGSKSMPRLDRKMKK